MRSLRGLVALATVVLGFWGLGWCLPDIRRAAKVLPPQSLTHEFRGKLKSSWQQLHERLGEDILLSPEAYSPGFHDVAVAEPGWTTPPPLLLNSARSYFLRSGHEDESDILFALSKIKPWKGEFNPRIYFYGGAYLYPLGTWIAAGSLFTPAQLKGDVAHYLEHPDQLAWLYRLGRSFSVISYWLGAILLFLAGRRLFNEKVGLAAAALYAAAPGVVLQAHYMKPHLLAQAFVIAAFWACAELTRGKGGAIRWPLAGACVGLAGGCALPFLSAGGIVALAALLRLRQGRPWKRELAGVAAAAAAAVAAFVVTNPYLIGDFGSFWHGSRAVAAFADPGPTRVARFLFLGLPKAWTWPVWVCVALGAARPRNLVEPVRALALGSFIGFVLFSWVFPYAEKLDSIRYFPGNGIGLFLAALWVSERGSKAKYVILLPALYAAAFSALLDFNLHRDRIGHSTRDVAGTWIEQNIPAGSELGFLRLPQPSNAPYFPWNRYRLKFIEPPALASAKFPENELPDNLVLVMPSYDERPRLKPVLDGHYELLESFRPAGRGFFSFPPGEIYGNPLIQIYRLKPRTS